MNIETFFKKEKGIKVDAAFKFGAKYTAVDMCKFAEKYLTENSNNFSKEQVDEMLLLCVEFGYKACEKGDSLGKALREFKKEVV